MKYSIVIEDRKGERLLHTFKPEGTDNRKTAITWLRISFRLWKEGDVIRFYDGTIPFGMRFVKVSINEIRTKLLVKFREDRDEAYKERKELLL